MSPMLCDVFPNGSSTISPVCQHIAPAEFNVFQQLYGMNTIVIISGREKELHWVAQPVYNGMELCVQTTSGTANCLICRFFPRHWRFRVP